MAGAEDSGVAQWLYATLSADSTLTGLLGGVAAIYDTVAPESAVPPYIVFSLHSSTDSLGVAATRIFVRGVWLVKAVDQSDSFVSVSAIYQRLDALLQKQSGTATNGTHVYSCSRQSSFRLASAESGLQFRQQGGLYRIVAQ